MFELVIAWLVLSCTVGPLLTWAFFYPKRRADAFEADRDRWAAAHPTVAPELMPAWPKWENAGDDHVKNRELAELHQAGPRRRSVLTTAVVVLVLATIGALSAILLRNGAAAEADASIVEMGRSAP